MTDYKVSQKIIHALMALCICLDLFIANKFGHEMASLDRLESRGDHSSMGIIITVLLIIRLAMRLSYGAPPLPAGMTPVQVTAAKLAYGFMYFAMLGLVTTGVITGLNATDPIIVFKSAELNIGNLDEGQFQFVRQFHGFFTNAMLTLIVVHIAAAMYHSFVLKDDSTRRMLKFWTSK